VTTGKKTTVSPRRIQFPSPQGDKWDLSSNTPVFPPVLCWLTWLRNLGSIGYRLETETQPVVIVVYYQWIEKWENGLTEQLQPVCVCLFATGLKKAKAEGRKCQTSHLWRGRTFAVYYESMKRKLKIKPIYECRCNGRLQTKRITHLAHTRSVVELGHLKIKTRLTNEKFASVKGECEI
jgi:hypothetical protein